MGGRLNFSALLFSASLLLAAPSIYAQTASALTMSRRSAAIGAHRIGLIEGEVHSGDAFERQVGEGIKILLEPIASGWVLRVVPSQGPRELHDYAEIATPPYQSVSPLLISTDFSFRAQDALAWNPRHFRFAASRNSFVALSSLYGQDQALASSGPGKGPERQSVEAQLASLVSVAPEGEFTILDARLVQGTGDQGKAASLVALHPNASAREIDQPLNGVATPLGHLNWIRFRIRLDLPSGFKADRTVQIVHAKAF